MAKKRTPPTSNPDYVKLGENASAFADPYSRFKIHGDQVKQLTTREEKVSGKIRIALRGGHLSPATEAEFKEYQESVNPNLKKTETSEPSLEETLEEKTKAQLVSYYEDNFQVEEDEVEAFRRMSKGDMVEHLLEISEE